MEALLEEITQQTIDGDLDAALTQLRSIFAFADSEWVNDTILLQAQARKLRSDTRKGILDFHQEQLTTNRLVNGIMDLIGEIRQTPEIFNGYASITADFEQANDGRKKLQEGLILTQILENDLQRAMLIKKNLELSPASKQALYNRLAYVKSKNFELRALWVDDHHEDNAHEINVIKSIGILLDTVATTEQAMDLLRLGNYNLLISDIGRQSLPKEGLTMHRHLLESGTDIPTIFYTAYVRREKGTPAYAFGIAEFPNEFIHLVLDVIERLY